MKPRHILIGLLFVVTAAIAQTPGAGLSGVVTDSSGARIPGVTIALTDVDSGALTATTTDAAGTYSLPNLTAGKTYRVTATLPGFQSGAALVQAGAGTTAPQNFQLAVAPRAQDFLGALVGRLNLDAYKGTIKSLTQFGDRRQGTERNRAAIDWIEARLKEYGCANTERLRYEYPLPAGQGAPRPPAPAARARGVRVRPGVNNDPGAQPDEKLRALNSQPTAPGPREQVYCTKIGTTRPDEMYIVGAHMDGIGYGEAANDNASGTALVMELARVFNSPDIVTERSIRFILWNNEETGLEGSRAYVAQRAKLQGIEDPPGSGKYPEPRWLAMIQHDMMLFDHGMPQPGGRINPEQRPEADVNIEFAMNSKFAAAAQELAWRFMAANERYATDYPASIGRHMSNTDSASFQESVPSISLRENERGSQIGNGWNPHWHQPTDLFATFSDNDFRLGLNAAQTTLAAVAELAGAAASPRPLVTQ